MISQKKLIEDRDWDCLIVLDACRYDSFEKYNRLKGNLQKVESSGSHTTEWLNETFQTSFENTVYISGNPRVSVEIDNCFDRIISVWDYGWKSIGTVQTVPPSEMVFETVMTGLKKPKKRLISHFMQPHEPYIGAKRIRLEPKGWGKVKNFVLYPILENRYVKKFTSKLKQSKRLKDIFDKTNKKVDNIGTKTMGHNLTNIPTLLKEGELELETVRKAYRENLKLVLHHVKKLVEKMDKLTEKIIITADHGESFRPPYGHQPNSKKRELLEVPWFEVEK